MLCASQWRTEVTTQAMIAPSASVASITHTFSDETDPCARQARDLPEEGASEHAEAPKDSPEGDEASTCGL